MNKKVSFKKRFQILGEFILRSIMNLIPKENVIVFSSSREYEGSAKYLYFYLLEKHTPYEVYWLTKNKYFYDKNKNDINLKYSYSLSGIITFAKASIYVVGNSIKVFGKIFTIPKNRIVIQTGHGVPIKTVGWLAKRFYSDWEIMRQCELGYNNENTYVLISGEYEQRALSACYHVNQDRFLKFGQPRNIIFKDYQMKCHILKESLPSWFSKNKIVLYAPTWRGYGSFEIFPFKDGDIKELNNFLKKHNIVLIVKMHPFEKCDLSILKDLSNIIEFSKEWGIDNQEIQIVADLLITDYSSIYCDYINTLRPIAFMHYDIEEYKEKRGLMEDNIELFPGPIINTFSDFMHECYELINNNQYYFNQRKYANYLFNGYENYDSMEKLTEFINSIFNK